MATVGVKNTVFCRVQNDWDEGETVVCRHPETLDLGEGPIGKYQDPFRFMYDGITYLMNKGDSITLALGVVKHLIGDWDVKDPNDWDKEQQRVLGNRNFIPKVRVDIIETPEEAEKRKRDKWRETKYPKPTVGRTTGKAAPKTPIVMDEEDKEVAFEDEAIKEAEAKKKVGRPKKED